MPSRISPARRPGPSPGAAGHRQRNLQIPIIILGTFTSRTHHYFWRTAPGNDRQRCRNVREFQLRQFLVFSIIQRLSRKTKDNVQAAIASLEFLPNPNAAALRRIIDPAKRDHSGPIFCSRRRKKCVSTTPEQCDDPLKRATDRLGALKQENRMLKRLLRRFNRDVVKASIHRE